MKEGWVEATLGEVCKLNYGKPLPKSDRAEDAAYPVFGANGVKAKTDKFYHEGPSIIVGRKGSAGEINIVSGPFWPLDVTYFTTHDENCVTFDFLHYWLVAANLPKMAKGVKPGINRNEVYALPVLLPPLEEQRRIVAVLDEAFAALDRARENVEANLAAATELKISTVDEVFQSFVKLEDVAELPLNKVCNLINGRAYKKKELLHEGKYRVLRVGNFFTNKNWYYSNLELPESKYCEKGDLLYAWSASFGPRFWREERVIYHYHIWKVEPDLDLVLSRFLFHFFEWDKEAIKRDQGAGTTMIHVSKGSMEKRLISLPSLTYSR